MMGCHIEMCSGFNRGFALKENSWQSWGDYALPGFELALVTCKASS